MKCYYDQQIFMVQADGGISRYFFELIRRLDATGPIEATVFAGFYVSQLPLHTLGSVRVLGVRRRFKVGPLWHVVHAACNAANRRLLAGLAPAIYHPTYYCPAVPPVGTRMVITVYDMIHEKFPDLCPVDDTVKCKRAACAAADAVICISESTRQDLLSYYPKLAAKTSVVHLAAATAFRRIETSSAGPIPATPYALFVGGRKGYKGFDLALEAWQQLARTVPDLRLVCVGGGAFDAAEAAEIQRRGLGARISHQNADDARLAELYRQAALFIYPSRYEGFGLPILEAMACGCPVVCSRSSSLPEVGGAAADYFEPGAPGDLAAKVQRVMDDARHRADLIRAGDEQCRRFSWEECARQTEAVYRGAAGSPRFASTA